MRQLPGVTTSGPLHGLPTAVKDLMDVAGFATSHGSAAFAGAPAATHDCLLAEALRRSGAIIIGKTNTPEFGLGTLTFNPVFGTTVNPYDPTRHAGGSSGGAAAALAAGMLPIADGSDSGGSLRYPAAFCNVVGLRPTAGRVAIGRVENAWSPPGVLGPMGRDSRDVALLLAGIAGAHRSAPMSIEEDPVRATRIDDVELAGLRIGWSNDAGGLAVDPVIRGVHAAARTALRGLGCEVVDAEPDFTNADEAWEIIETFNFFSFGAELVHRFGELLGADFRRNVAQGAALTAAQLAWALARRTEIFRETAKLLTCHDVLIFPATPVVAPDIGAMWVSEVDGIVYDRYFRWQQMANRLTMTAHPVLVTPAGFTASGLPVGMQLVGAHRREATLLSIGAAIEVATGHVARRPAAFG
jgi:amidase